MYRAEKKSLQILLSSTQAGPGKKVKQEQEDISRNHVPRLFLGSVYLNCVKIHYLKCVMHTSVWYDAVRRFMLSGQLPVCVYASWPDLRVAWRRELRRLMLSLAMRSVNLNRPSFLLLDCPCYSPLPLLPLLSCKGTVYFPRAFCSTRELFRPRVPQCNAALLHRFR